MARTGLQTATKIAKVLEDAGVIANINDVTRIVIDLRGGQPPVIHLELIGDDRLVNIAELLSGAEVKRMPKPDGSLVVQPGDTLVLRFDRILSMAHVDAIRTRWREAVPDVPVAIVECDEFAVIRAPHGSADPSAVDQDTPVT